MRRSASPSSTRSRRTSGTAPRRGSRRPGSRRRRATGSSSSASPLFPAPPVRPARAAPNGRSTGNRTSGRHFEFTPPGPQDVSRGRQPASAQREGAPFGALVVAKPKTELSQRLIRCSSGSRRLARRPARRRLLAVVPVAPDHQAGARALRGGRRDLARKLRRRVPETPGGGRSATSRTASARWRRGSRRPRSRAELPDEVSHELRTPLTAIRGHVEALARASPTTRRRARPPST